MIKYSQLIYALLLLFQSSGMSMENDAVLNEYIRTALEQNPLIHSSQEMISAKKNTVQPMGTLPDPQITFGLMNLPVNSFAFDQEPMTGKLFSVMQMFPFPGKLGLSLNMAGLDVNIAQYKSKETENTIIAAVKNSYYDIYTIDRAVVTIETNKLLLQQMIKIAETKYANGMGLQQDVLRAHLEMTRLEDDHLFWKQKRAAACAMLNSLLNRPADSEIKLTNKDLTDTIPDSAAWVNSDIKNRPLMKAWKEMMNKSEIAVRLAHKDYYPNFNLGLSYSQRNNLKSGMVMHDFFSATVSMNVPLYFSRRQTPRVQEKIKESSALKFEYENLVNQMNAQKAAMIAELVRNKKRIDLYQKSYLLLARQSLDAALTGYQVDKVDFITLLNSWTMLQNYEFQYYKSLADYHKTAAELEKITGLRTF